MMKTLIAVAVAGAFALPVLAQPTSAAGDSGSSGAGSTSNAAFDRLDKNHDGALDSGARGSTGTGK